MLRRRSTGEVIDPAWTRFSFPTRYLYDVLRGLDYLRSAGVVPDERVAEAIELVKSRRGEDGRWPPENVHAGDTHVDTDDGEGQPSRWNTLPALRVLPLVRVGASVIAAIGVGLTSSSASSGMVSAQR